MKANNSVNPLAVLSRATSTPHLVAHGFAFVAQTVLCTGRRLTGREGQNRVAAIALQLHLPLCLVSRMLPCMMKQYSFLIVAD